MITNVTARRGSRARRGATLGPVVALSCGLLLLAGCSTDSSTASPQTQPSAGGQAGSRGGMGGAADPGRVSGEIAAVDGKTLQIQDGTTQTAVTYTGKTVFRAQVAGAVSDIAEGDCVLVISTSTQENATAVTATSVTVSDAVDGVCTAGFGGGPGGMSGAGGGTRPSGAPSGQPPAGDQAPSGAPRGDNRAGLPRGCPAEPAGRRRAR